MDTCYQIGNRAEHRFAKLLNNPIFSTRKQDMEEHWDLQDSDGMKYDVKAIKRIRRDDEEFTDQTHYIEFRNVRGKMGWLYGMANYIVFETRRYWIVVNRRSLMAFAEGWTEENKRSPKPEVYKLYQREGKKDLMTLVPTVDLLAISEATIKKPNNI